MTDDAEEWIGYVTVDDDVRVLKIDGAVRSRGNAPLGSITVSAGWPNDRIFGLACRLSTDATGRITGAIGSGLTAIRIAGHCDGDVFTGVATAGEQRGRFEVRRVVVWDLPAYRALSARYELADGRRISIHVNADEWVGAPVMFYAEQDRFVRLYPDAHGDLVSESAELFTVSADRRGIDAVRPLPAEPSDPADPVVRLTSWRDEDVTITGPAGTLSGTLMTPPGPRPHSAVVMIHGAAGGLRDFYRAFAEQFLDAGVAALVYDRRGWGESTGASSPTFEEKSHDAEAWVDFLQSRPAIRADRVGVWGFSNGSWVAPMVAARRPDVAFVAVIGAAGTTALETEIHRRTFDLDQQGVPADQVANVEKMWRILYRLLGARVPDDADRSEYDRLAARVSASAELAEVTLQEYAVQQPFLGPVPPYPTYQQIVDDLPNFRPDNDMFTCDPVDSYRVIRVPVLYLVGENDSNVPALLSAERVTRALTESGNVVSKVAVLPNTGHSMNISCANAVGMSDEEAGYRLHNFRFAEGYLDMLHGWLRRHT